MKRIFVPTRSYADWQRLLAQPHRHWKAGFSAMTLAQAWEASAPDGLPPEVRAALDASRDPNLTNLRVLLVLPEYQTPLPGGDRASQTDVLVLGRGVGGLVAIAVEGKVNEEFGPTLGQRRAGASEGAAERITYLATCLGLCDTIPDGIRYQLLHRTGSALLAAEEFGAKAAVMLVHSFSPEDRWLADFGAFAELFGKTSQVGHVFHAADCRGIRLFLGWCKGDQRFRRSPTSAAI